MAKRVASTLLVVSLLALAATASHNPLLNRLERRSIAHRGALTEFPATADPAHRDSTTLIRRASSASKKRAKKGLGITTRADATAFGSSVSWAYNWASAPPDAKALQSKVQYVPQLWGQKVLGEWLSGVKLSLGLSTHLETRYILGMNEPDLSTQSDLTPAQAVKLWRAQIEPVLRGNPGVKACSPAVTNGGGASGVAWLKSFISECKGCHISCVAMHWYDSASNVAYFKNYFSDAQKTFAGKPIWITEFMGSGTIAQKQTFLKTVVPWLRSQRGIQRFAAFGRDDAAPFVTAGGQLTPLGRTYRDA